MNPQDLQMLLQYLKEYSFCIPSQQEEVKTKNYQSVPFMFLCFYTLPKKQNMKKRKESALKYY
jgi:hypothetical protein